MKKIMIVFVLLLLCGCYNAPSIISETVVQKDVIPEHNEIYTDDEYKFDLFGDSLFKKMPITKSRWVNEQYQLVIEIKHDDDTISHKTVDVNKANYDKYEIGNDYETDDI